MLRVLLRSKIHRATITESDLNYEGSITIDQDLMDAAQMFPYEQVMISNLNNGERFATYVIPGKSGSGAICLNGPTARKGVVGDRVIIFCYAHYNEIEIKSFKPIVVAVDDKNKITSIKDSIH
ncbi:MAG: aspartate 1-decarboxylase [Nitrospirota bacterium]